MAQNVLSSSTDLPPAYTYHQHACIALSSTDCLRLIRFPSTIINLIRQAIHNGWSRGVQREDVNGDTYEFKLSGNPWWGQGDEAIPSRILMIHILSSLYSHGWYLLASTDISKKQQNKDSLFFQVGAPAPRASFFAISFNEYDKLRLICVPHEIIPAVRQAIGEKNIQREDWYNKETTYQIKLRGYPWASSGDEGIAARRKLLSLLDCFATFGWKLYASVDMSVGYEGEDTDTWFLRRDVL